LFFLSIVQWILAINPIFPEKVEFWHGKRCEIRQNNLRACRASSLGSPELINAKLPDRQGL